MGVPKFFRWMSERYPGISQVIAENRIPEFDCLYLDMNGIIHNCTHKDSDSPTFRMTEDKMFINIFNYIEHLFGTIKPKQLFFMAIDGVAPRAKMNQQRSRRFRTALDAEKSREKAVEQGLEMPKEDAFDSNCITPGTEFMARLTQQLKYFINKKISEDADWQDVEVVLSGHEVPGEGEHKIMEYIRQAKSQPNYNPNMRHCLYGLDADLIMLGLLSHDPHFCLLREEVTFGRGSKTKSKELEHQNFYLMHLCIVREYLELEFQQLKEPGRLSFPFDLESIIDDFILMAFFVGNDFLPNLPYLHINEGALALMFDTYKAVLPRTDGYINQQGEINLKRLELLLDELANVEYRFFESENSDANWLRSKQRFDDESLNKPVKRGKLVLSTQQKQIWQKVKKWINNDEHTSSDSHLDLSADLPARDREFVKTLADSLHVQWSTIDNDQGQRHMRLAFQPKHPSANGGAENGDDDDDDDDDEAQEAILRVTKRYDNAQVVDVSPDQAKEEMENKYQQKFIAWKDRQYTSKFEWGLSNEEEMRKLTENYVQGLQWVLYYYYRGVASWPWFYAYHYSPMISDVKKGLGADMNFKLGQPFRPFQQLMGVLPDRSKAIVPPAYHELMTSSESPIIDFYPRDFDLDMNGKKQEWEAVVKIPFIQEDRLLAAMKTKEADLTDEERQRNDFGVTLKFTYSPEMNYIYPSTLPGVFNDIQNCHCVENIFELPTMEGLEVHVGLVEGVKLGVAALAGFPSLKTLPFAGELAYHGVNVFQQDSRNQSMIITLLESEERSRVEQAKKKLGKVVYVGYPFLQEAKVTKVSDELFDYTLPDHPNAQVIQVPHEHREISDWQKKSERLENVYSKRLGIIVGTVECLVHVEMLKGLTKTDKGDVIKEYAVIPGTETDYASQTIVDEVISEDARFIERAALPLEEEFPLQSRAFFLGELAYGRPLQVVGYSDDKLDIVVSFTKIMDENWARKVVLDAERSTPYTPSYAVAKMLNLNPLVLSKLTSSFSVEMGTQRLNLGLNLKFEARKQKVLGYSRRGQTGWEFSKKAIDLIVQYMVNFPEFIAGIQRRPQGNTYEATDFYPAEVAEDKIKEIDKWLKSIEAKNFERVPLDADQLDSDTVLRIEQVATQIVAASQQPTTKKMRSVPRHACLRPSDTEQRLSAQKFVVGDRLVYVQDSGKVPVGLTGTVVGLTRTSRITLLDVLFDTTFMSGSSLGDRSSPFRGATVPASSVLNLTNRQVIASTRASTARQTQPSNKSYYVNGSGGYGAPTGPGNQGQLVQAAPPPRLAGGWSNVVNGQQSNTFSSSDRGRGGSQGTYSQNRSVQSIPIRGGPPTSNGHRGRGSAQNQNQHPRSVANAPAPNNRGYTIVDNSDPTEGVAKHNPNFRKQNYSFVPPPSSLDQPRGRGYGRGRGARAAGTSQRGRGASRGTTENTTQ